MTHAGCLYRIRHVFQTITLAELKSKYDPSPAKNRTEEILHASGRAGEAFKALVQTR